MSYEEPSRSAVTVQLRGRWGHALSVFNFIIFSGKFGGLSNPGDIRFGLHNKTHFKAQNTSISGDSIFSAGLGTFQKTVKRGLDLMLGK